MEGGQESVEDSSLSSKKEEKSQWVSDWLDSLCPYYMIRGVSCEDFWHGDYTCLKYYVETYDLNRQRKSEEMWLQGLYNYRALSVVIGNVFKKKGSQSEQYPDNPIRIIPYTEQEKEEIAERERQKTIEYFNRLAEKWENSKE